MIFSQVCINLGPALQEGGWAEGGEGRVEVGGGEGGGKTPQVKTRGHQSPSDGPDHSTTYVDRRDTIPAEGRISGWLYPIGVLHRCQSVGQGFTRL